MVAVARIDFDPVRDRTQCGFHAAHFRHPFGCCVHGGAIQPGADVSNPAFSDLARDGRGLAIEPAVALAVGLEHLGVFIIRTQQLSP